MSTSNTMSTLQMFLPLIISLLAALVVGVVFFIKHKKKRKSGTEFIKQKNRRNNFSWLGAFYDTTPFISREYRKIKAKTILLYPGSQVQAAVEATKLMSKSLMYLVIGVLISIILAGEDIYFFFLGIFLSIVIFQAKISSSTRKAENLILDQLGDVVSDLISTYKEYGGHLDDALYDMLVDMPYPINQHIDELYRIATSAHPEEEATAYTEKAPNNYLLSLVSLIVPTVIYGDKTLPDGNTTFVKGLMNLTKQINEESLKRRKIDIAFSSMEKVTIVPILAMKPLEKWFFLKNMPETASYFSGPLGISVMTAVFLSAFIAMKIIDILRTFERPATKESNIFTEFLDPTVAKPTFLRRLSENTNTVLNLFYSKHYTKCKKLEHSMEVTGDRTGFKAHVLKSLTVSASIFMLLIASFMFVDRASSYNALTNFKEAFSNTAVPDPAYTTEMETVAKMIALQHKGDYRTLDRDEIVTEVRENTELLKKDDYINAVADAVENSFNEYETIYFRWYYVIIAFGGAALAFFVPTWLLKYRAKTMEMQKEDEVNSFNMLAMIFMDMGSIQVSTLLEWMERFSYSYKPAIQKCIINLDMGENRALEELRESDDLRSFRKFIKKMESVDKMGFRNSFIDIEIQQDHYNEKRKLDNEMLVKKRSKKAGAVSWFPMIEIIMGWVIGPMFMYAMKMLQTLQSIM